MVFGLPGVQLYHAMDAFYDEPGIRFITTRHEQATAYMADGFSRAGGGIGTALVVPGPGLLNATAALNTAYAASSPVMMVSGQIERDLIGVNRGMLHEVDDQLDIMRTVTKWAARAMDPAEVPETVHEAFQQVKNGRPRPVEIEIPPETLAEVADVELPEPEAPRPLAPDRQRIAEAARMLAEAKNPLIWAGGGTISSGASDAVRGLAEHMQMPVIATAEGKGVISDRHPLSLGSLWLRNDTVAGANSSHGPGAGRGDQAGLPHVAGRPAGGTGRRRCRRAGPQLRKYLRCTGRRTPVAGGAADRGCQAHPRPGPTGAPRWRRNGRNGSRTRLRWSRRNLCSLPCGRPCPTTAS